VRATGGFRGVWGARRARSRWKPLQAARAAFRSLAAICGIERPRHAGARRAAHVIGPDELLDRQRRRLGAYAQAALMADRQALAEPGLKARWTGRQGGGENGRLPPVTRRASFALQRSSDRAS